MPTDLVSIRAKLVDERAVVAAMIALFDVPDELAKFEAAEAALKTAQAIFEKKSRRWTLINEKLERLEVLDAQIDLVTPDP
jgi:exonuclease V gamma subunit